jgi:hypothetical protein
MRTGEGVFAMRKERERLREEGEREKKKSVECGWLSLGE